MSILVWLFRTLGAMIAYGVALNASRIVESVPHGLDVTQYVIWVAGLLGVGLILSLVPIRNAHPSMLNNKSNLFVTFVDSYFVVRWQAIAVLFIVAVFLLLITLQFYNKPAYLTYFYMFVWSTGLSAILGLISIGLYATKPNMQIDQN
jgi:hypothetical protein